MVKGILTRNPEPNPVSSRQRVQTLRLTHGKDSQECAKGYSAGRPRADQEEIEQMQEPEQEATGQKWAMSKSLVTGPRLRLTPETKQP